MPKLRSSNSCAEERFEVKYVPDNTYKEVITTKVLDSSGMVKTIVEVQTLEDPCIGLDANHFRLSAILASDPSQLQKVDFVVSDPLNVIDNINNLNNSVDAKLSEKN